MFRLAATKTRSRGTARVATLLVLAWLMLTPARAQDAAPATQPTETAPSTQPADPADLELNATELNAEDIRARIAQIEAAKDLPDTTKSELLNAYRRALGDLELAGNWAGKAAEYRAETDEAPQLLERVRAELNAASTQPADAGLTTVPADASLDDLTRRLSELEATLQAAEETARQLDAEVENRRSRAATIPQLRSEANKRLSEVTAELATPPPADVTPQEAAATRARLLARKHAIEQEIKAYDAETRFFEARSDLLSSRRELARLRVTRLRSQVEALRQRVTEQRQKDVERQQQQAEAELERTPQAIREMAETNAALARELTELEPKIPTTTARLEATETRTKELTDELTRLRRAVTEPVLGDTVGPAMRRLRADLLELRGTERVLRENLQRLDRVWETIQDLEDQRVELANRDKLVTEKLERLQEAGEVAHPERLEPAVRDQLERRYQLLSNLERDYREYRKQLRGLIDAQSTLLQKTEEAGAFLQEHVLWVRSATPLYAPQLPDNWPQLGQAAQTLLQALVRDARRNAAGYGAVAILVLLLWAARRRARRELRRIHDRVTRIYSDKYALTVQALGYTLLLAAPWPLALYALGARIPAVVAVTEVRPFEMAEALGLGLRVAAFATLLLAFAGHVCRPQGLGEAHFRWNSNATRPARFHLLWLTPLFAVASIVVGFTERYPDDVLRGAVGRLAFMAAMLGLAVFAARLLHPRTGALANWLAKHTDGWAFRLRYVWYGLLVSLPGLLMIAAAAGWYYTAIQLAKRIADSTWLVLGLVFVNALLVRGLFVAQRKLAIERARRKRAAAEAKAAESDAPRDPEAPPPIDEAELNLGAVGDQTRKILRSLIGFALVIGLWLTWADLLPAVSFVNEVTLWEYTVETSRQAADGTTELVTDLREINLGHALVALIITVVTVVMARNMPGLLEITLLRRLPIDMGGRFAVTSIARYTIIVIGATAAFGAVGIGWAQVQWLAAAAAVGLGFGLQEIFANFVSGLMLLFERPIRIGDTVTVGNVSGTVTRIRIRATTITDWDRKELIIPNKEFITGQVINWSLSDQVLRITLPVGIAYGSDTKLAAELLAKVADEDPNVLKDPKPMILFMGFGDSTLDFELRVYLPSIDNLLSTRTRLNFAIDNTFRAHGVEIAFPQRDLHIRSIRATLPIADARGAAQAPGAASGGAPAQ